MVYALGLEDRKQPLKKRDRGETVSALFGVDPSNYNNSGGKWRLVSFHTGASGSRIRPWVEEPPSKGPQ